MMFYGLLRHSALSYQRRSHAPSSLRRAGAMARRFLPGLDRKVIHQGQEDRLRRLVDHLSRCSPYYQRRFEEENVSPAYVRDLEDLPGLPLTDAEALEDGEALRCIPEEEVAAVYTSAGTTGRPKRVDYSAEDQQMLTNAGAIGLRLMHPDRLVAALALPMRHGLWIGWRQTMAQIERAGGLALPLGQGDPAETLWWIRHLRPGTIVSSPSYMARLTEEADLPADREAIDRIVLGGELLDPERQRYLTESWNAEVHNTYATTELGVGLSVSPPNEQAVFFNELHVLIEIIDPDTGEEADEGEIVFTTLTRRAMPLLRYRSGDRGRWRGKAPDLPLRMLEVLGRVDETVVVAGVTISGRALAELVEAEAGRPRRLAVEATRTEQLDTLSLRIEGSIDGDALRDRVLRRYPRLADHVHFGATSLAIEERADLTGQVEPVAIDDRRPAA